MHTATSNAAHSLELESQLMPFLPILRQDPARGGGRRDHKVLLTRQHHHLPSLSNTSKTHLLLHHLSRKPNCQIPLGSLDYFLHCCTRTHSQLLIDDILVSYLRSIRTLIAFCNNVFLRIRPLSGGPTCVHNLARHPCTKKKLDFHLHCITNDNPSILSQHGFCA